MSFLRDKANRYIIMIVLLSFIVVAFSGIIYLFVGGSSNDGKAAPHNIGAAVEVERVEKRSLKRKLSVVGVLGSEHTVVVKPQVRGVIDKVFFKGGEKVEKDQVLAKIDDRIYKAEFKEAKAKLILADAELKRIKRLVKNKAVAGKNLEKAEAEKLVAEAAFEKAKFRLDSTEIKAPFEGYVGIPNISEGMLVNEQTELFTVNDNDPMRVDFKVPAEFVRYLSVGDKIKVSVDELENAVYNVEISNINPIIDNKSHSISLRSYIPNSDGLLKPGFFANVELVAGTKDNAKVVPEIAIQVSPDEKYVYKVGQTMDGRSFAQRVPVTTGLQEGEFVEVYSNELNIGDLVVVSGQVKIQDGYPVRIIDLDELTKKSENQAKGMKNEDSKPVNNKVKSSVASYGNNGWLAKVIAKKKAQVRDKEKTDAAKLLKDESSSQNAENDNAENDNESSESDSIDVDVEQNNG